MISILDFDELFIQFLISSETLIDLIYYVLNETKSFDFLFVRTVTIDRKGIPSTRTEIFLFHNIF